MMMTKRYDQETGEISFKKINDMREIERFGPVLSRLIGVI